MKSTRSYFVIADEKGNRKYYSDWEVAKKYLHRNGFEYVPEKDAYFIRGMDPEHSPILYVTVFSFDA